MVHEGGSADGGKAALLLLQSATAGQAVWIWTVVLTGSFLVLWALARCGSALFWKAEGVPVSGTTVSWTGLAPAIALILASLALTVLAAPTIRYTGATAEQLMNPAAYIGAVLGGSTP